MTFWLMVSKRLAKPPGVDPAVYKEKLDYANGGVPAGVDRARYSNMFGVSNHVEARIARCFAGSAWLRRRFPARSHVGVYLMMTDDASASVAYLTTMSASGSDDEPQSILCGLRIPKAWLAGPEDGLLGLRLFQAVLHALRQVGEHYGIGMPAAAGPSARGDADIWDPFGPPPPPPSYADINTHLQRLAASLHPEQLLLAVKEPTSGTVARQCRRVREALGAVVEQHILTGPDTKATAWTIRTPS